MKYLLDTHIYFWIRSAPQKLSRRIHHILSDPSTEAYLSVVTPWEMAIKAGTGKMNAAMLLVDFEPRELAAGFKFASITTEQAIRSGLFPSHHRDPFDRLLIAQALEMQVPIISKDKTFDLYGVQRIWD